MSGMDWLFNGQPPPNVTGGSGSGTAMPEWYMQFLQGMAGKGLDLASQGYPTFPGQRLADFNPTQQLGFQNIYENQGAWQPQWQQAQQTASGIVPFSQSQINMGNQAAQGAINATQGPAMMTTGQLTPALGAAGAMGGAAMNAVGGPAANWTQNWQQYMSPYTQGVTNEIARLGNQQLFEQALPGVQENFISGGGFGSQRNQDMLARTVRDQNYNILGQQSQALQQGYGMGANIFGADANRAQAQQGMQGQTALGAGNLLGGLASTLNSSLSADAARAQAQQGMQAQTGLGAAGQFNQGAATGASAAGTATQLQGGLSQTLQNQLGSDATALLGIGGQQQNLTQLGYDTNYQNFLQQRDWGWNQLGALNNLLRGYQMPTQTTTVNNAPLPGAGYGASPLGYLTGLYGGSQLGGGAPPAPPVR